ncbi:MAG: ABC transporter permease [Bacteroidales bacterium]|nr:ABC transporter permease [Bacteroidales bacterium]
MWKNFFYVALRNIAKNRVFSFINIAGLAIGLASAIIIILFITKELSFDRFHEKSDRIYRAYLDGNIGEQRIKGAWSSYVMAPVVTREIDEVVDFVRLEVFLQQLVWHEDAKQVEDNVILADSSFFDIFSIDLLYGDRENVLREPNSVVITREKALQYFGIENPLGKTLEFNTKDNFYIVTGVMEEFPENSHFFCDFLLSMSSLPQSRSDNWLELSIYSYLLLDEDADYRTVEQKINELVIENIRPQLKEALDITAEEWVEGGNTYQIFLQPLTNIHLNPDIDYGEENCFRPVYDRIYIYIFALIAFFILVIASINFMNLSTARSAIRAREIAMRKVVGSNRKILIFQFLTESVFLSFFALVIALLIVELSLPYFNQVMGMTLIFGTIGKWAVFFGILFLTLLLGILSGIYPAFYLSKYKPLQGLMGGSLRGKRSVLFRRIMVAVQFTISVAIIVGTMVVAKQVKYLVNKDHGFDDDRIIVIDRIHPLGDRIDVFCEEVEKITGVKRASSSSTYLGFSNRSVNFQLKGVDRTSNYLFDLNYVDADFMDTYGLSICKDNGRFFKSANFEDTLAVVINQTAAEKYKLKEPLNTVVQSPLGEGAYQDYNIIGVVNDFHHSSLRRTITPYMFALKTRADQVGYISIRFDKENILNAKTIKNINMLWNKMTGDEPFQFFYLKRELDKYYWEEMRTGRISLLFSILAIIIACLGLLGLTLFNTERRLTEIAIRKTLGANVFDILMIISKEILVILGISIVAAWTIAFFFMKNWLQVFPYNIGFTPGIYLVAALVALLVTMIAVNAVTIRAARSNPADSLQHE